MTREGIEVTTLRSGVIHPLWGGVMARNLTARAAAYADDGFIKADLLTTLKILLPYPQRRCSTFSPTSKPHSFSAISATRTIAMRPFVGCGAISSGTSARNLAWPVRKPLPCAHGWSDSPFGVRPVPPTMASAFISHYRPRF